MISRRHALLGVTALTGLSGCSLFTTTTTNGVTTVTINVAALTAYGQAFINGASLIGSLPGIATSPVGLIIVGLAPVVSADLAAFSKAANGALTLSFDSTSIPNAIQSLLKDGQALATDAQAALGAVAGTALTTAQTYFNAVQTVVALFNAALASAGVAAAPLTPMTEAEALATLKVMHP